MSALEKSLVKSVEKMKSELSYHQKKIPASAGIFFTDFIY